MCLVGLAVLARFSTLLFDPEPRADERVYLRAFEDVSQGRSPYSADEACAEGSSCLPYFYPPAFAAGGAVLLRVLGSAEVILLMRAANVVGLVSCLWFSLLFAPIGFLGRAAVAVGYVLLAPPALRLGFGSGNLSFSVVGAGVAAFVLWRTRPVQSGFLLGLSAIVKPVTPAGLVVLGAHRSRYRWQHAVSVIVGLAVAGLLTLATSEFLREFLSLDDVAHEWPLRRSVSLYRLVEVLGFSVHPLIVVGLVAATFSWIARRRSRNPREVAILALTAMALATPALWSHTLLVVTPVVVMAVTRAYQKYLELGRSRHALYEVILVSLTALALQFSDGIGGGADSLTGPLQAAFLFLPVWAPVGLALYAWPQAAMVSSVDVSLRFFPSPRSDQELTRRFGE